MSKTPITRKLRFEILTRDGYRCRYCGATPRDQELVIDHVVPEALGGPTIATNLVTCCQPCNAGKGDLPPDHPLAPDIAAEALLLAAAFDDVMKVRMEQYGYVDAALGAFHSEWETVYETTENLETGWQDAVFRFFAAGLSYDFICIAIARSTTDRRTRHPFRTFTGICWMEVVRVMEIARGYGAETLNDMAWAEVVAQEIKDAAEPWPS